MRKFGFIFLLIALMAGISVQAQKKKIGIQPAPIQPSQMITIQDDAGEGYMVFDLVSGAYQCYLCEYGYSFSGTGSVKLDGCSATFIASDGKGYTITAYTDICDQGAKCFIEVREMSGRDIEPMEEVLSDSNLRDSAATCVSKRSPLMPPPIDLPPEIILQNDEDGSFLYIDPISGAFNFVHCEDGSAMGGMGIVTRTRDWLSFEVLTKEYRVLASINLSEKAGKAVIDVFETIDGMKPMQEIISDNNLSDNVATCDKKK